MFLPGVFLPVYPWYSPVMSSRSDCVFARRLFRAYIFTRRLAAARAAAPAITGPGMVIFYDRVIFFQLLS